MTCLRAFGIQPWTGVRQARAFNTTGAGWFESARPPDPIEGGCLRAQCSRFGQTGCAGTHFPPAAPRLHKMDVWRVVQPGADACPWLRRVAEMGAHGGACSRLLSGTWSAGRRVRASWRAKRRPVGHGAPADAGGSGSPQGVPLPKAPQRFAQRRAVSASLEHPVHQMASSRGGGPVARWSVG